MKHLKYTLVILVLVSFSVKAQTPTKNYVLNTTYQISTSTGSVTNDQKIETITYYDGLGRPEQNRAKQAGGNREDILTPIIYDDFGRETKQYLPRSYTGTPILDFKTQSTLLSDIDSYYIANFPNDIDNLNPNPFSEKVYDNSPLNRVIQQGAPGDDWAIGNNNEINIEYGVNTDSDDVIHFKVNLSFANDIYTPTLIINTTSEYPNNTLSKTITKDENWSSGTNNTTEEFKDKEGRVILKRTYADISGTSTRHDTYYIYDQYGNLTYVLPPLMNATTSNIATINSNIDNLGYQYKYDVRNRLVEKKVPGKGWEYIVYNKLDQPVMTQDQNLKLNNDWLFTVYDAFGRVAYTGIVTKNWSRWTMQNHINTGGYTTFVNRTTTSVNINGTSLYYDNYFTNNTYIPTSLVEVQIINYYDSYANLGVNSTETNFKNLTSSTDTEGLPTVSKVKVLETSSWLTSVSYYDSKGRPIYLTNDNPYLGATDIIESDLDFTGKPKEIQTTHTKGTVSVITDEVFTYDHAGRMTKQTHEIDNSGNVEVIAQNTFDDLGQLTSKKVGNTTSTPLQTVDFSYNVRGWLKGINDVSNLGSNDLFAFGIDYNTTNPNSNWWVNDHLYNGNISKTIWITKNDNKWREYNHYYDDLNRIIDADYYSAAEGTRFSLNNVSYDKNGNIVSLVRRGHTNSGSTTFGEMDNLGYYYNGNQLHSVTDATGKTTGFNDGNTSDTSYSTTSDNDYTYDVNGNMTKDQNKGITNITYNQLNLPTLVDFGGGNKIEYFYDASGLKLKKKVTDNTVITNTDYAGNYIYENSSLKFFNHPEGYVEPDGSGGYDYIYQYTDHLGNIRLSYKNVGSTSTPSLQIQEEKNYYPFGLQQRGYNNAPLTNHKYGFGGKEEQDDDVGGSKLDWLDFGARNYDAALGRWMNLDPLAETMRRHSPYNYAFDNPIFFTDPDGMSPVANLFAGKQISQKDIDNSAFGGNQISGGAAYILGASSSGGGKGKNAAFYKAVFKQKLVESQEVFSNLIGGDGGQNISQGGNDFNISNETITNINIFSKSLALGSTIWGAVDINLTGTYLTTQGIRKSIYLANGATRSARAAQFALQFRLVRTVSWGFAGVGTVIDGYGLYNYYFSDDPNAYITTPGRFAANSFFTAAAIFGGPVGWIGSGVYFGSMYLCKLPLIRTA